MNWLFMILLGVDFDLKYKRLDIEKTKILLQLTSFNLKIIYLSTITKYERNSFDIVPELSLSNILKAAFIFLRT